MTTTRKTFVTGLALLVVLGLAALVWACTAQTRIIGLSNPSAISGTEVTVRGEGAQPGSPVTIFWNDTKSPALAHTVADAAGNFSAAIVVPQAQPDVHYIVAVPSAGESARAPFEVTSAAADSSTAGERSTDLWSGFSTAEAASNIGEAAPAGGSRSPDGVGSLGLGLLAVGATGLTAGLATMARRRARADA